MCVLFVRAVLNECDMNDDLHETYGYTHDLNTRECATHSRRIGPIEEGTRAWACEYYPHEEKGRGSREIQKTARPRLGANEVAKAPELLRRATMGSAALLAGVVAATCTRVWSTLAIT